ncbi:hypothetical protein F4553_001229 [Allocatelliglobosispora scoriae]|uniref:Uncharacterized protein n=1 Tax=Allocatelliglobosispora scoriae TaxID=643052 RepID=A0A841BM00_9ACTN|nr:hypothetical protein [Allocatelliglobosispora scoriae]MBB5867850.1 hypothetical protein [Allocatelliglobosispora scoriae]
MNSQDSIALQVEVADNADQGAHRELLEALYNDLYELGLPVHTEQGSLPADGKSVTAAIASVVLGASLSTAGIKAFTKVILAFVKRSQVRRIELSLGGDTLVLEGASPADLRLALQSWLDRQSLVQRPDELGTGA